MFAIGAASRKLDRILGIVLVAGALLAVLFPTLLLFPSIAEASDAYPAEVIRLVNEEREKVGAPKLRQHTRLNEAAKRRAEEAARKFSHTRPNGSMWKTIFDEYSVWANYRGENLAYGQTTPKVVVAGWMASEDHRKNILNKEFDHIAVGVYEKAGVLYWSQLFIQQAPGDPFGDEVEGEDETTDEARAKGDFTGEPVRVGSHVRVVDRELNVRATPSPRARVLTSAPVGTQLLELAIEGEWAYIHMSDRTAGWVSVRYLAEIVP